MWFSKKRTKTNFPADRQAGLRSRTTSATRKRNRRLRPGIELLENRLTPALIGGFGAVDYEAFGGEANNVVFSNGPLLAVHDDPNVGILATPPYYLSSLFQSLNLAFSVGFDIAGVEAGVSLGYAFSPFQFPGTVIGPPVAGLQVAAQELTDDLQNAIARSIPQGGSSVVPAAPVTADGNVYFKVQAASSQDHLNSYQLYQAAIDPAQPDSTFPEQEYNDDPSPAGANLIPPFGQVSRMVTGDLADGTPDYFRFHADAGQRIVVILDNNPDRATEATHHPQKVTGTALSLWGPPTTSPPLGAEKTANLSTVDGNAVGAFDVPDGGGGDYYVGVRGLGLGTGTDYQFVVLKLDPAKNSQAESSSSITVASPDVPKQINANSDVTSSLVVGPTAGTGHITSLQVSLNISHQPDSDLSAYLVAPDGITTVKLFGGVGDNGADFGDATTDTTFDDGASTPIDSGSAPFSGSFRPQEMLSKFNGLDPRGTWQLKVTNSGGVVGTINHWSITYTKDESSDMPTGATPLSAGQFGNGVIEDGDTDFWSTPAKAGQLIFSYVDTQNSDHSPPANDPLSSDDSTLAVLGADGTTVLGSADNGGPVGASAAAVADAKNRIASSLLPLSANPTTQFNIDVGNTGMDTQVNSVDVSTIHSNFTVWGGSNVDTLIAGSGTTTFNGYASSDVLVNNFTLPSVNTYYGGPDLDTILVQGLVGDDTIDIDFHSWDLGHPNDPRKFTITEDGVPAEYDIPDSDVEQILVQGLDGNDTLTIHGTIPDYLTSGINFEGGDGENKIVLDNIDPTDSILYRKGADDSSGSITMIAQPTIEARPPIIFDGVPDRPDLPAGNQLVVFPHDFFEHNDTPANATAIGAGAALNQVATIDPAGDQDWYKFTAQETGTLDFQVNFLQNDNLPDGGKLDVNVYDAAGHQIGTGAGSSDVAVPVVRNQTYFLQVTGAPAGAINVYNFSAINVPAPPPFQVDLTDASDTGRDNHDNVTDNLSPSLNVFLDDARLLEFLNLHMIPGTDFGVDVYDNGVRLGTAAFVGPTNNVPINHWVYQVTPGQLQEGSNFLTAAVWFQDRATPAVTGRGDFSLPLQVVLDTTAPPPPPNQGLAPPVNTTNPGLTNNPLPTFNGIAEPGAIIRLYADRNCDGKIDPDEVLLGTTVASLVDGRWSITSQVSLNDPKLFTRDGERCLLTTAEDQAGNVSAPSLFVIFLDTQGPQVTNVYITNRPAYNLFGLKPTDASPTPRIDSITVSLRDQPTRDDDFLYAAIDPIVAAQTSRYVLRGDLSGIIPISQAVVTNNDSMANTARVELRFAAPLPDDRYTLTVSSALVDPVGNALDGESNATQPTGGPQFPSGDGIAGGDFVARFTVDSRPEIGTLSAGRVFLDINGNGVFDPSPVNNDQTNRDLTFTFGLRPDVIFAGNFAPAGATSASGFSKLAAYGQSNGSNGPWRFLLDFNGDGVPDLNVNSGIQGSGWAPVAGNFAPGHPGDEIGLFNGGKWVLDSNGDNILGNAGDAQIQGSMKGLPFVGDFDGDGLTDLATYNSGVFSFDLAANGLSGNPDATINFGFLGSVEQPIAGDINLDGVTDVGLWVPEGNSPPPSEAGQWYFLVSAGTPVTGKVNTLNHAFSPAPLGTDLYYEFGQINETPIFGNFDPPVAVSSGPALSLQGPSTVAPGASYTLNLAASGAGADALNNWTVNWGDGTQTAFTDEAQPPSPSHTYANGPGTYTVSVSGNSSDGGTSATGTAAVTVDYTDPNQRFVSQAYLDVLQRPADAAGLAFWTHSLDLGMPRTQVALALEKSAEHCGIEVDRLYQTYLHRPADPAGRAGWVAALMAGVSETDVARTFLSSSEYTASHADALSFVNGLYADVLGRAADPTGQSAMLQALQEGESRTQLAWAVLTSPEHYQQIVQALYENILHRPPDATGLAGWISLMQSLRVSDEQISATLAASDELFRQL
jgi:subtilisin-like proprotein convertase family protein